jgi:hypothetical protein
MIPRPGVVLRLAAALAVLSSGCGGGDARSLDVLVDGSPARAISVELEDVDDPIVVGAVRRQPVRTILPRSRIASCLRQAWSDEPVGIAVLRIGVDGESVTFAGPSRRVLHACDDSPGRREGNRAWCGLAFGRLYGGVLRDPRLDLGGCQTRDGKPVAFAWVEPGPETRYVVLARDGLSEVYETAAGLPVRVSTTSGVDVERSSAVLPLSEHAADGRLLRARRLEARVAG